MGGRGPVEVAGVEMKQTSFILNKVVRREKHRDHYFIFRRFVFMPFVPPPVPSRRFPAPLLYLLPFRSSPLPSTGFFAPLAY